MVESITFQKNLLTYLFLVFVSFIFLLLFSTATSPLFYSFRSDSAVYIMIGKMFVEGKIPYVDFFEHKGPMLIFIEAIGQLLSSDNRTGAFILQNINLSICLIIIYHCCRKFISSINSLSCIIICLLFFTISLDQGNLTEEYSLPFLLLTFYFTLEYALSGKNMEFTKIFAIGICSGILFWLRLNNTGPLLACIFFILYTNLIEKKTSLFFKNIGILLTGFLLVTIPLLLYFIYIGAFNDMIYAAFLFNLKYTDRFTGHIIISPTYYIAKWFPIIIFSAGFILGIKTKIKKELLILAGSILFFSILSTFVGPKYNHYMTLNTICLLTGLIFIFESKIGRNRKTAKTIFAILVITFFVLTFIKFHFRSRSQADKVIFQDEAKKIAQYIPMSERNSVYGYLVDPGFYIASDIFPCYKFFVMQELHGKVDKEILSSINHFVKNKSPKWIVVQNKYYKDSYNENLKKIIREEYILYRQNDSFLLFNKKTD